MNKQFLIYLFIFISLVSFSQQKVKSVVFKDCSAEMFKKELDSLRNSLLLIDTRKVKRYKRGRIKGAESAQNLKEVLQLVRTYPKDKPIFIYCETGDESITISALLMRNGYNIIYNLKDGIDDWWRAGYRLDRSKASMVGYKP